MKKIAFFVQWMLCGGVENALIALAKKLVENGNDVTIYVISMEGDFINKIPAGVHIMKIPMDEHLRNTIPIGGTRVAVRKCLKRKKYFTALKFIVKHRINSEKFAELNVRLDNIPKLYEQFDIAVNFHMHSPFLVWFLSEKVNGKKKYTWIHNDFNTTKYDIEKLEKYLKCVDHFFAVSQQVREEFISCIPSLSAYTSVALNIVPAIEIKEKANEFYPQEYKNVPKNVTKILTVGRLEEQKGYDWAIDVCQKLVQKGYVVEWFVLGEGTLHNKLAENIEKKQLSNVFHLLGTRMNPYPYFKNCDVYVQTSKHEGWGLTLTEAKICLCPIVSTDFAGAREQIVNGVNGTISSNDASSIFDCVEDLLSNTQKRIQYKKFLRMDESIYGKYDWLDFFDEGEK